MLDDLKLKNDINALLSALGSNTTLTELDIRSNRCLACLVRPELNIFCMKSYLTLMAVSTEGSVCYSIMLSVSCFWGMVIKT